MANDRDLFSAAVEDESAVSAPLAARMRPQTLDDYSGQEHLLGEGAVLRRLIEADQVPSLILWGPPGCGKTTLGKVIANSTSSHFIFLSAIGSGVKELRVLVEEARDMAKFQRKKTILFIDEIHRYNKTQCDALLPYVESGLFTLIGATTENPSFEINGPLLSRCKVMRLEGLTSTDLMQLLARALQEEKMGLGSLGLTVSAEALAFIAEQAQGDARSALNTLETAAKLARNKIVDLPLATEAAQKKALMYDKGGEEHYNVISAFIKSIRGSDPDAALYWLARMLEAGEDPIFIARRLVISASEDVGNADPRALQIAVAATDGLKLVGLPEGRIILAQAVSYLACAPKSNASYLAIGSALAEVSKSGGLPVPLWLRNAPTQLMKEQGYGSGYRYAHDYEGAHVAQQYLPDRIKSAVFYHPSDRGYEKTMGERLALLRTKK